MASRFDCHAGVWRRRLFFLPLLVVLAALVSVPVMPGWKLLLAALAVLLAVAEWQRQHVPRAVQFAGDRFVLHTGDGRSWTPLVPLHRFQAPGCLALRCISGDRVRWLTLFADEMAGDGFIRLNREARALARR